MSSWSEFYQRHDKRVYTPVFNTFLDSQIADDRLDLLTRTLAWVIRNSWGRHSDVAVDAEGIRQGQVDAARDLKALDRTGQPDRRKISPVFLELQRLNMLRMDKREIGPVDDPGGVTLSSPSLLPLSDPFPLLSERKAKLRVSEFIERIYGPKNPAAYEEYQNVERRFRELRTEIMTEYKAYAGLSESSERGATNEGDSRKGERHDVGEGSDNLSERDTTSAALSLNENLITSLRRPSSSFSSEVGTALANYGNVDDDALNTLIQTCRAECAEATAAEIVHFIEEKGRRITRAVRNPVGFLLTAVPKCFHGPSFLAYREQQSKQPEEQGTEQRRAEYESLLNDPSVSEREKQIAREMLGYPEVERKPVDSELDSERELAMPASHARRQL